MSELGELPKAHANSYQPPTEREQKLEQRLEDIAKMLRDVEASVDRAYSYHWRLDSLENCRAGTVTSSDLTRRLTRARSILRTLKIMIDSPYWEIEEH